MRPLYSNIAKFLLLLTALSFSKNSNSQISQQWIHRYTGPQATTDEAAQFTVDNSGNTYLTGTTIVGGGYSDIITVKFNSAGVRQWIAKYNGVGNLNDNGTAIQIDANGNVYTLGNTYTSMQDYNIILIKYDQNGVQQWTQMYNGPANSADISAGIDLDSNGNIYTGGYSSGVGTSYDFILMKFNSSGVQQWVQRWNGTANSDDFIKKIAVAGNGDVIIAGSSYTPGTSSDFITQRYNPSGILLWSKKYNGLNNNWDEVTNLKTDLQNNIYVCGKSYGTGGYDIAVVKYNSAGDQKWVSKYIGAAGRDDIPSSVTSDLNGNVFITGYSYVTTTNQDYATIKYDSNGVQQWIRTFNGVQNYFDKAYDIVVDSAGNSFVTGQSLKFTDGTSDIVTLMYNPSGVIQWSKLYDGPGQLDDIPVQLKIKSGYLYIIGSSYSYFFSPLCGATDFLTLKYGVNSNFVWEARFDAAGTGTDESASLAIDNSGNTYVTGFSYDIVSNYDYATIKYNSTGAPLWVGRYDNGNGIDKSSSVTSDNSGNVYVTGNSQGASSGKDIATIKYNSAGSELWVARYNGSGNGDDYGVKVGADISGNVYVSGYSDGSGSGKDYVTVKYNSSGVQQWVSVYNGPGNSDDQLNSMFLDSAGNIYVTGNSIGSGTMEDIATVKYNSSGTQQWVSRYNGSANNSDIGNSVILDSYGNVIICGNTKVGSSSSKINNNNPDSQIQNFDIITIKYNSSGVQQWTSLFNGTDNGDDEATSLVSDNSGNIYISGNSKNISTGLDYTTIKYNSSGSQIWASNYNGSMNSTDKAGNITIDLSGNLYVTGSCNDIGTGLNYCTIKYNSIGEQKWIKKYNYIDNDSDKAVTAKVDIQGNVFVTGSSKGAEGGVDFATIKYIQVKSIELTTLVEGFYDDVNGIMVTDTAKVYLRNSFSPYNIVDSSVSELNNSGKGTFIFPNAQNGVSYFIIVDHRNSLDTWSSTANSFLSGSLSYDFTDNISKAYGSNLKQKGSKFCLFSGDVNKDDVIDAGDLSQIENGSAIGLSGMVPADVNGDEVVDASDLSIVENNTLDFHEVIRP